MTEVLAVVRTSGLLGVHRANGSKETIKRAGHSIAVEVVHKLRGGSRGSDWDDRYSKTTKVTYLTIIFSIRETAFTI